LLKALLFDLDGTLLPLDFDLFVKKYFQMVATYFENVVETKLFLKHLMLSTEAMIKNTGSLTNEELFMQCFLPAINQEKDTIYPLFEQFYTSEFPKLKEYAGYSQLSSEIVGTAVAKGYRVLLATNPVFPELATRHRMVWAGVDEFPWEVVTTYENCCTCKPNPNYFREICAKTGLEPEECLMIGNNVQEDLVAGTLGMKTFLVTDCIIDRGQPAYIPDYQGTLEELYRFVAGLAQVG